MTDTYKDASGTPIVFVVYDRARKGTTGNHRVATFRDPDNADSFLEGKPESYYVSCQSASVSDMSLAQD